MARYSVETNQSPGKAIERASVYFGEGGLGLDLVEQNDCCVLFEGGGGYVSVTVSVGEKKTIVDLETREWDYHVKRFMEQLS
jgi:hypothetical protein